MAEFGGGTYNSLIIYQQAAAVAKQFRQAVQAAQDFHAWISAQLDADLNAAGVVEADVTAMKSMAADLNDLCLKYSNSTGDGSHALPYNYAASSNIVIGPF